MKISSIKSLSLLAACGIFSSTFALGHSHHQDEVAQQHWNTEGLDVGKAIGGVSKEEKEVLERLWGFEVGFS